ncbi:hypothetical protein P4639_22485 [Priestia megaterium]|uniref:hypothetical protein n=1 Tax=Priestia megaterium TaxID=1404 RepID=UPI002E1B6F3B|nr:hypothetical protein [Priestia megaterium]
MLTLNDLNNCFDEAIQAGAEYIGVIVKNYEHKREEIIINHRDNFTFKKDYYNNAYNQDLQLNRVSHIRIIGFAYGFSFSDLEDAIQDQIRELS